MKIFDTVLNSFINFAQILEVETLSQYNIPLRINAGITEVFPIDIDNAFFTHFENSELKGGELKAKVSLTRNENSYLLSIAIKGYTIVVCDRCLDLCKQSIDVSDEIIADISTETNFDTGDVNITVATNDNYLDMSILFHDMIVTALPVKRIHNKKMGKEQICNPEMIEILKKYIADKSTQIDARWNKLNELTT